ncbi:hypothetical protein JB92DRAFT_3135565 [Gautieria morchelliformis]|nr:hypothetical protein JB92DRAFT_3135565 [Gautieria morchelliformis]
MAEALAGLAVAGTGRVSSPSSGSPRMLSPNAPPARSPDCLLDLNELIGAEEAQPFSRLPTLMTALDIYYDDQTPGGPPEVKSEGDAQADFGLTETVPSEKDCHDELQSLAKKLKTKNVRAFRKEALVYAFKQGEVNKTLDNLQKFQQQLVVALSIDQATILTNLRETLYETYDRILLDIDESNRWYALKLLQWLAFSVDTVSLSQAVKVLATDPDAETGPLFDADRRPRHQSIIPRIFKDDQGQFTELRLVHFSVREYLVSECLRTHSKLAFYNCDEKLANTFVAKTCASYFAAIRPALHKS